MPALSNRPPAESTVAHRLVAVVCLVVVVLGAWLAPIDQDATRSADAGLKRALVTYASVRVMHGIISALQGTQVDAAPAGIGVVLAPGQLLAPASEMLRQVADWMLLVCVSFGVQKLLIAIGGHVAVSALLTVTA